MLYHLFKSLVTLKSPKIGSRCDACMSKKAIISVIFDIFLNAFSAKTSIESRRLKTTSNQKKEARSKNNFEKANKRAPASKVSGTFCKLGRPSVTFA